MGSRSNTRRSRGSRRGLATFVSFVVLFALALGQGSSLIALADDAGIVDPVATEEVAAGGVSTDATLPAEEAPAEEAPAEEAPAEEAPAEEAPAEEASAISSGGAGGTRTLKSTHGPQGGAVIQSHDGLHGGDISLDFVAAGPFTYNHTTGVGGEFGDRTISKTDGVVESLEGEDFECGDLVVFFTQVVVDETATGSGSIEIDYAFGAETTGQPGVGFTDIWAVSVNTGDSGMIDTGTVATATLTSETLDPAGDQPGYDEVLGTVTVTGLDPGDEIIVRLEVRLGCEVGATPTGNVQSTLKDARVVGVGGDTIRSGEQTIPLKKVEDIGEPGIVVTKTCPAFGQVGDTITYTIKVQNTGNETLNNVTVTDTLLGDLSGSFADSLAAEASETQSFTYTVKATDPDPLPNTVTASGTGATSNDTVTDTASCSTDILKPAIDVTKTCPAFGQVGDIITYTITVENTGDETLNNVTVTDTLLGNLSASFDDTFSPAEKETHTFNYTVLAGGLDPLPNTVTASGTGATSNDTVTDTASCSTDLLFPAIQIVKDGPALVHRGDTINYTFEVTNTGEVELFDVELTDPICDPGTILPGEDVDASLAVDEVWHFTCMHLVTDDDPDPILNTAIIRGDTEEGEGGNEVTDSDDHVVDIIRPAIRIVKTVSEEIVEVGDTVTYTYKITNTGDTTLYDISVDDDILGHIGDIPVLDPGVTATLTKDFVVGDEPVINVAIAEGEDILGRSVSDDDDAIVTPILGENPPNPPNNPPTPFTGSDAGRLGLITMVLAGIGVTVVAATRRRRPEREAA